MAIKPKMVPKAPIGAPPTKRQRDWDAVALENEKGMPGSSWESGLTISLESEDGMASSMDEAIAIEQAVGRYWKIGVLNDYPCFRQQAYGDGAVNGRELFMYHSKGKDMNGWMISSDLSQLPEATGTSTAEQPRHVAWSKPIKDSGLPQMGTKWHLPYYTAKCCLLVTCETTTGYLERQLTIANEDKEFLRLQGGDEEAKDDENVEEVTSEPIDEPCDHVDKYCKNENKGKGKQHGGWAERSLPLIVALLEGRVDEACQLTDQLKLVPTMMFLLAKHHPEHCSMSLDEVIAMKGKGKKGRGRGKGRGSSSWNTYT
jgi:hypothetical protein